MALHNQQHLHRQVDENDDSMDIDVPSTSSIERNNSSDSNSNDNAREENVITLCSAEGKCFTLTKEEAACSNVLKVMLKNTRDDSQLSESIKLPSLNTAILSIIVAWCKKHPTSLEDLDEFQEDSSSIPYHNKIDDYDRRSLAMMKHDNLLMLINAADYLDVSTLFKACCYTIAKSWESKRVDDIRRMYKIEGDLDDEEDRELYLDSKKLGLEG